MTRLFRIPILFGLACFASLARSPAGGTSYNNVPNCSAWNTPDRLSPTLSIPSVERISSPNSRPLFSDAALPSRLTRALISCSALLNTSSKREVHPLQWKLPPIVQMSLKFIRTVRNGMIAQKRWLAVLPYSAAMLNSYL